MSVGAWDPNQATGDGFNIDMAILERFISLSENDQLDNLTQQLDDELINRQASLMKQEKNRWVETAAQLSSDLRRPSVHLHSSIIFCSFVLGKGVRT